MGEKALAVLFVFLLAVGMAAAACPTQDDLQNDIAACNGRGLQHYNKTESNCVYIHCLPAPLSDCPSKEEIANVTSACKAESGFLVVKEVKGCTRVSCDTENRKSITCKKVVDINQCSLMLCNDGYSYNSCTKEVECVQQAAKELAEKGLNDAKTQLKTQGFWARLKILFG